MRISSKLVNGFQFSTDIRGNEVIVDMPTDQGGENSGPMPPELVATALGTCVGIYAVVYCQKHMIPTDGMTIHTDWEKGGDPIRIIQMSVDIELPAGVPDEKRAGFMRTVEQCMVHNTFCQIPQIHIKIAGV